MNRGKLEEKVIAVVGGTTGLGLSAAKAILAEGGHVVCLGRNADSVNEAGATLGRNAQVLQGDATVPDTAPRLIAHAIKTWGRLDGLYHVAGGSGRKFGDGPLHEITDEGWETTLRLNLTSLFYSNRAVTRHFLETERGGSVLNMGSVLGFSPSPKHFSTQAYATTKAAIEGLTVSSAARYADRGIRFNVLAPALVETPMARRAAEDNVIQGFIRTKQPLDGGRIGRPGDLDAAAVYFLSDDSAFVTGQVLYVDGGWRISEGQYGD
jgi:NAD(P)-dependent dehydrogenase (short-subunit alcohol dehydrogenase family)